MIGNAFEICQERGILVPFLDSRKKRLMAKSLPGATPCYRSYSGTERTIAIHMRHIMNETGRLKDSYVGAV